MELALFQLENLTISRSPFTFLDLRETEVQVPPNLARVFTQARKVAPAEAEKFLSDQPGPKDRPIVLMCENGKTSGLLSEKLEAAGYANVYIVAGGVEGLLSEV